MVKEEECFPQVHVNLWRALEVHFSLLLGMLKLKFKAPLEERKILSLPNDSVAIFHIQTNFPVGHSKSIRNVIECI